MISAIFWSALATGTLLIGMILAYRNVVNLRWTGLIMAFGSGAIISGAAIQLILGAVVKESGAFALVGLGLAAGALTFYFADKWVDRLGGTAGMLTSGWSRRRISWLWLAVCGLSILAAVLGYGPALYLPGITGAAADAFAGGALLVMLADSMIPEAFEHAGKETGLALVLGFGTALAIALP